VRNPAPPAAAIQQFTDQVHESAGDELMAAMEPKKGGHALLAM
jgi:hypothetical protein